MSQGASKVLSALLSLAAASLAAAPVLAGPPAASSAPSFEENVGQTAAEVSFLSRGADHSLFLTPTTATLVLEGAEDRPVVRWSLLAANQNAQPEGRLQSGAVSRYLDAASPLEARHFEAVRFAGVYPGIDLVYRHSTAGLEYDFLVGPGVDPEIIRLRISGADHLALDDQGDLVIGTSAGEIRKPRPLIFERLEGTRRQLAGGYELNGSELSFKVEGRNPRAELVIDPAVVFSTYLGGSAGGGGGFTDGARDGADFAVDCASDAAGNVYMTGVVSSPDFPTANAFHSKTEGFNPWIAKLSPGGKLLYATYLPGTKGSLNPRAGFNGGTGVVVDAAGNAYVAGLTQSTALPTTTKAFQKSYNGGLADSFAVKLDPTGKVVYFTYVGGDGFESISCQALGEDGSFYVSGTTSSANFPIVGGVQSQLAGGFVFGGLDVFVAKINPEGSAFVYSTFFGGGGDEATSGLAVDRAGNAYFTGWTSSTNLPLVNPFQSTHKGGVSRSFGIPTDVFVVKLSASGDEVRYATLLGGSGPEYPDPDNFTRRIAVDAQGNTYVTSDTASTDFPVTPNALQPTYGGGLSDVFLTKLNSTGGLVYSTYLGGSGQDRGRSIVIDGNHNIVIAGQTFSADFPLVAPVQVKLAGDADAFVTQLDPALSAIRFSTYLGGSGADGALGVALAPGGLYVAGSSFSSDFPTTPGALQPKFGGGPEDAFLARLDLGDSTQVFFLSLSPGLNLVSLPLSPREPLSARDLARLTGATQVIRFDEATQRFQGFDPKSESDGFAIEGGKGYFVLVTEAKEVPVVGAAWTSPKAPIVGASRLPAAGVAPPASVEALVAEVEREFDRVLGRNEH